MGAPTTHYNLYKPSIDENGWGEEVNESFDVIDSELKANADAIDAHAGDTPAPHPASAITVEPGSNVQVSLDLLSNLLNDHNARHEADGPDAIKLDDLEVPDDNTDLDASTARHGLLPKLPGGTTDFLRADGTFATPPGSGGGGGNLDGGTATSTYGGITAIDAGGA